MGLFNDRDEQDAYLANVEKRKMDAILKSRSELKRVLALEPHKAEQILCELLKENQTLRDRIQKAEYHLCESLYRLLATSSPKYAKKIGQKIVEFLEESELLETKQSLSIAIEYNQDID